MQTLGKAGVQLSKNQKIYDVQYSRVVWYTYLCVHPHAKNYSILIDMNEDPMRIYNPQLEVILNKNLKTYEEAQLHLADILEQRAIALRKTK